MMIIFLLRVSLCIALFMCPDYAIASTLSPGARQVDKVISGNWYEVIQSANEALGHSFRVFFNQEGYNWIQGFNASSEAVEIIKMNRLEGNLDSDNWDLASVESAKLTSSGVMFFGLGQASNMARTTKPLSYHHCMECHTRHSYKDEPVFSDFYVDPGSSFSLTNLNIIYDQNKKVRQLVLGSRQ